MSLKGVVFGVVLGAAAWAFVSKGGVGMVGNHMARCLNPASAGECLVGVASQGLGGISGLLASLPEALQPPPQILAQLGLPPLPPHPPIPTVPITFPSPPAPPMPPGLPAIPDLRPPGVPRW